MNSKKINIGVIGSGHLGQYHVKHYKSMNNINFLGLHDSNPERGNEIAKKYETKYFENVSKLLYFKVWEHAGLPYSFYQHYSAHEKKDYFIKDSWKEHLKERCIYPANFFQLGYEF